MVLVRRVGAEGWNKGLGHWIKLPESETGRKVCETTYRRTRDENMKDTVGS